MIKNIDYVNMTYDQMIEKIKNQLASDPKFANIRESGIFTTLVEIFLNAVDISNFYIQNQANECFLDTAKLYSSVILLSRMLGYVPARPEPASSALTIEIVGPLSNDLVPGDVLYFNRKTSFTYNNTPFILKNTYKYTFTESDIINGVGNPDFSKVINYALISDSGNLSLITSADGTVPESSIVDIELLQGEIKSYTILGSDSDIIGMKFQKYVIPDVTISNIYGDNDLGFDHETGVSDHSQNLTRVAVSTTDVFAEEEAGTLPNYDAFYDINRKTLLNVDSALAENLTSAVPIVWMRSSLNKEVELIFGDNLFAKEGIQDINQNIYMQYFSTLGEAANKLGVVGQELQPNASFFVRSIDFSNNLVFSFRKNITGGYGFEDVDSIKLNAPSNYAAFERCVTSRDYTSFLKTLTTPINVVNAVAWGEQEESENSKPIPKLFNVALFSCIGSLYDTSSDVYSAKTVFSGNYNTSLSAAVLDDDYSPYTLTPSSYFNVLIKESVPGQLNVVKNLPSSSKIARVTKRLDKRSQMTVRNVYITPFIDEFQIVGNVYLKNLSNINYNAKVINNSLYSFFNQNADFGVPIYLSNIVELIEANPNVVYSDVTIAPLPTSGVKFSYDSSGTYATSAIVDEDIENWIPVGGESTDAIKQIYKDTIDAYLASRTSYSFSESVDIFSGTNISTGDVSYVNNITEKNFYNELCKTLYNELLDLAGTGMDSECFANSTNFTNTVIKLRNSFDAPIKWSMIKDGNIELFSSPLQIIKMNCNQNYLYRG